MDVVQAWLAMLADKLDATLEGSGTSEGLKSADAPQQEVAAS